MAPKAPKSNRQVLEALAYRHTHADYKGKLHGKNTVLNGELDGGGLAFVSELTVHQLLKRLPKAVREKFEHDAIERVYYARCKRVQIPLQDIPKIFAEGAKAIAEGIVDDGPLGDRVAAFVETIRTN